MKNPRFASCSGMLSRASRQMTAKVDPGMSNRRVINPDTGCISFGIVPKIKMRGLVCEEAEIHLFEGRHWGPTAALARHTFGRSTKRKCGRWVLGAKMKSGGMLQAWCAVDPRSICPSGGARRTDAGFWLSEALRDWQYWNFGTTRDSDARSGPSLRHIPENKRTASG